MATAHSHHREPPGGLGPRLLLSIAINVAIMAAQLIGGMLAGSLALVADALHNLTDVASLSLSYVAFRVARRPASDRYTFAYQRSEVLVAVVNGATLIGVSVFIAVEAIQRLRHPEPVAGGLVIAFALFGMVANAGAAWLLRGHGSNLNVRSAVLHLVSDSIASLGVLVAGVLIRAFGWYFVDPLASLALAGWMIWESVELLRDASHILMQGVPEGIELDKVSQAIDDVPGVDGVHDLRVWALTPENIVLSAHLVVTTGMNTAESVGVMREVKRMLHDQFGVEHATLEVEDASECAGISCAADDLEGE